MEPCVRSLWISEEWTTISLVGEKTIIPKRKSYQRQLLAMQRPSLLTWFKLSQKAEDELGVRLGWRSMLQTQRTFAEVQGWMMLRALS